MLFDLTDTVQEAARDAHTDKRYLLGLFNLIDADAFAASQMS